MIAKIAVFLCIAYTAQAGYIGSGLGYSSLGYSSLGVAPAYSAYSAPLVTKTVIPSSPIISAYSAPAISSSYISAPAISSPYISAPIVKSYASPAISYGGVYGGYGLGARTLW